MNLILTSAARLFAVLLLSKMEAFVLHAERPARRARG
jgi:hypothetical protein